MLKNDIEKTLLAHKPVPPEGFAERTDYKVMTLMQKQKEQAPAKKKSRYRKPVLALAVALVLCFVTAASRDLIIRPDKIRARETATPLVTALSEGKGEETDGEGEANARGTGLLKTLVPNDDSRAKIEYDWPELANSLVPVNASCEKQGIRWEMKAAAVKDDEALFVYTLKDLQGDRINVGTGILHWPDLTDDIGERDAGEKGGPVSFDEATGELLYAECIKYKSRILPEDRRVTVGFENLSIDYQTSVDLLPMLEQYGEKAETVDPPTLLPVFRYDGTYMRLVPEEEARKDVKVLDYTKPLNVPLAKDITLTGIGWVDDVLHVQLHYANNREGRFYTGITSPEFDFLYDSSIRWDENNDGVEEWVEFMSPDKLSGRQVSSLSAKIIENTGTVEDKWEVQIPLADILLTAEEPAAREEETETGGNIEEEPQWKATLQAFFEDWALKDTDYLLLVCADAWKESQADPEQAVKELVDARRPAGYRINGITGWDGDPVRMLDVTVKWLGEDGGDTYTRHEVALRLQRVTPAVDAYRVDPEGFSAGEPAQPVQEREMVLLTEEAILRNALRSYPELRDHSVPINLSVEKQGIRMKVVSGCLQENIASFLVKVRDVEGKYNGLDLQLVQTGIINGLPVASTEIYRNKAENYTAWVCTVMPSEFDSPLYESDSLLAEPDSFSLNMNAFQARDTAFIDLVPLLKEHTRTEEGVTPPDGAYTYTKDGEYTTTVRMKVFDSKASQEEIPLLGNIFLSGIGWIDGQLHVQLHIQGRDVLETDSNRKSNACMVGVTCFITGKTNDEVRADGSPVIWDENNNLFPEWYEYVFNCTPEDVDQMMLNADLGVYTDMLYDDWSVEIPMNLLLQKDRNGNIEYEINPEGFKNGLTAEVIPDADLTLVTEAEMIREVMDAHVEEVAFDELAPIGLSMEKQGIRMEVVSGCRKGDNAYFLLTTQELNGEYSDYSCDPPHDLQTEDGTVYGHYIRLRINRTENTTTWLYCVDLSKAPLAENNALRVGIEELDFKEEREVDLLPLLELDGRTEEGITLPENYPVFTIDGKRAEDGLKVLNDEGSLDIHLDGNTYLSAIGWIGDQLHVQLVRKNEKLPDPAYNDLRLFINCSVTGKPYEEIRVDGSPVSWFNLQNETSREEYIFNCTPEDVDSMRLYGYGTIMRATLRDDWTVEVPLDLLPDLTAAETAEREEETDVSFCLKRFFSGWAAGNTVYVENALTFHTEPDHPDGDEAAKEIMASGTPRGIKLHSISGTKNDPVRTLDVTVQWDAEDGVYRYTRYALELWMQKDRNGDIEYEINPESFKNGSAAEAIPDADLTLVTEAQMIREIMDAHVEEVAYDELTPIGLSTEKQGFRMEMVSGCRKGDYVYFLLNMLDLEGKYSGYDYNPVFEEMATEDNGSFGHCAMLRNNRDKNKTTWLYRKNLSRTIPADNNTIRAGFTQFSFSKHNSYDLLPMLKEYGRTEEGVTPPDRTGYTVGDGKRSEDKLYILNYEKSLDIHLGGNVFLSAIGWIGNQLHVQFQEKPWSMMTEYPDVPQDNYRMTANCNVQDKPSEETTVYGSPMIWTDPDEGTSREEYVFNCTPEDLDRMELRAFETQSAGDLQADWTVEVPLDLLPDLNAAAETVPAA